MVATGADIVTDMEVGMVADMGVAIVADLVAYMVAEMIMDMVRELVVGVGLLDEKFVGLKLTRLAHLLIFAS